MNLTDHIVPIQSVQRGCVGHVQFHELRHMKMDVRMVDTLDLNSIHVGLTHLIDKATPVEANVFRRLIVLADECHRALNYEQPGDSTLTCESVAARPCPDRQAAAAMAVACRERALLRRLAALLRAKMLRRLYAESRGRRRLSLAGARTTRTGETGSAAATAKRMFPLGAPPLAA
jgi:hypothetical protein